MVDDLRELFSSFDQDNSGAIEREELGQLLQCMGQSKSEDEVDRLFNLMDADGSGLCCFHERWARLTSLASQETSTSRSSAS